MLYSVVQQLQTQDMLSDFELAQLMATSRLPLGALGGIAILEHIKKVYEPLHDLTCAECVFHTREYFRLWRRRRVLRIAQNQNMGSQANRSVRRHLHKRQLQHMVCDVCQWMSMQHEFFNKDLRRCLGSIGPVSQSRNQRARRQQEQMSLEFERWIETDVLRESQVQCRRDGE